MDTAWIALIGTVFGGAGLKIAESFLSKGAKKEDTATELRKELRSESQALKEELREAEKQLDLWKEKYFTLLQDHLEMKSATPKGPVEPEEVNDW